MNPKKTEHPINSVGVRSEDEETLAVVQAVIRRPLMDADADEEATLGTLPRMLQVLGIHLHDTDALRIDPDADGVTDGRLVFIDVNKFRESSLIHKIKVQHDEILSLTFAFSRTGSPHATIAFLDKITQDAARGGDALTHVSPAELSTRLVGIGGERLRDTLGAPDATDAIGCWRYTQEGHRSLKEALSAKGRLAAIEAHIPEARALLTAPLDTSEVEETTAFNVGKKWDNACFAAALGQTAAQLYTAGELTIEKAIQTLACAKTRARTAAIVENLSPINPALEKFIAAALISNEHNITQPAPYALKEKIVKIVSGLPTTTRLDIDTLVNSISCFEAATSNHRMRRQQQNSPKPRP